MSVPYHEVLKTPYNIKKVKQNEPKVKLIDKEYLQKLEEISNYDNLDQLVKNHQKNHVKRI